MTRAGLPTATTFAGRSRTTTAPAPTTVFSPIVTPGQTMTPPPSQTLSPIVIGCAALPLVAARARLDRVGRGEQLHVRADLHVVADR